MDNERIAREKTRVLVLYADAGFGHRSAASAVAEALVERHGDQCEVILVNPLEDRRAPLILRDSQLDYDRMVREMPDLYKLSYKAIDSAVPSTIFESALTVMLFEVMRDLLRRTEPDAIISTYPLYQAPLYAVFAIYRRYTPLYTVVTDLSNVHRIWFNDHVNGCLVPTEKVYTQALEAGLAPSQVALTGIPVRTAIAKETRSPVQIRAELGWDPDRTTLLAVGGKRMERLPAALNVINHCGFPVQLAIVAGGDESLYAELEQVDWHIPVHLYNFVENIPELMHASDMVVCKAGGLIVTEALACGLPLLLVEAIAGQETGNASYVMESGTGTLAESDLEVLETVYHWLSQAGARLAQMANNAQRLGRPSAAYAAAELVWSAAVRGPADWTHQRILGRPRLLDLLKSNKISWRDRQVLELSSDEDPG